MEYQSGKQTNDFEYTVRKPKLEPNPVLSKYFKNGEQIEWFEYVAICTEIQNYNESIARSKELRASAPPRPPVYQK
jgi:hypothetical protein